MKNIYYKTIWTRLTLLCFFNKYKIYKKLFKLAISPFISDKSKTDNTQIFALTNTAVYKVLGNPLKCNRLALLAFVSLFPFLNFSITSSFFFCFCYSSLFNSYSRYLFSRCFSPLTISEHYLLKILNITKCIVLFIPSSVSLRFLFSPKSVIFSLSWHIFFMYELVTNIKCKLNKWIKIVFKIILYFFEMTYRQTNIHVQYIAFLWFYYMYK